MGILRIPEIRHELGNQIQEVFKWEGKKAE